MNKIPHKHAELIKAWADGAKIQWNAPMSNIWHDMPPDYPKWVPEINYRIAPELPKFRVALLKTGTFLLATMEENVNEWEKYPGFLRWLTPWIEYDPSAPAKPKLQYDEKGNPYAMLNGYRVYHPRDEDIDPG